MARKKKEPEIEETKENVEQEAVSETPSVEPKAEPVIVGRTVVQDGYANLWTTQTVQDKIMDLMRKARDEIEYCDDFINMRTGNMRSYESYRSELYEFKYKCRILLESEQIRMNPQSVTIPALPIRPKKF